LLAIEKLVVSGDEVFVLLHVQPRDGASFRNVEHLVFTGSQLKKVEVYFGDPPDGVSREDYPRFLAMASEAWKASARGTR
jgi:hypothetical protein